MPALPLRHRVGIDVTDVEPAVSYWTRRSHSSARLSGAAQSVTGRRPSPPAAVRCVRCRACTATAPRARDRAVGVAVVLDDRRPHPRHRERRTVERVDELGPLDRLAVGIVAPEPDVAATSLVVAEPADRRHLEPGVGARRVHLDVEAAMVALAHVAGADLDDAVRQPEPGDRPLGACDHVDRAAPAPVPAWRTRGSRPCRTRGHATCRGCRDRPSRPRAGTTRCTPSPGSATPCRRAPRRRRST